MRFLAFLIFMSAALFWAYREGVFDPVLAGRPLPAAEDIGKSETNFFTGLVHSVRAFGEAGWGSR